MKKAIFIAATGQNIGKTTTSLGVFSGLQKRFGKVGFIKPVGQQHVTVEEGLAVDKDVVLFKEHFHLNTPYQRMSPMIVPSGFTRDYLDGKVSSENYRQKIETAFAEQVEEHDFTLVEGTGHMGVGSILGMNNAVVAKLLDVEVVIVVSAGIGSAFDELSLNRALCEAHGVRVAGVIINRIKENKKDMILDYMGKALKRWDIPLIGTIPFSDFLSSPSMKDFENLFKTEMLAGEMHRYRHFSTTRLVTTSTVDAYMKMQIPNQLIITHASRKDIVKTIAEKHHLYRKEHGGGDLEGGIILTGKHPPRASTYEEAKAANIPLLYAPVTSYEAMRMISSFVGKIRREDTQKVEKAIELVESHVDFDLLTGHTTTV